MRKDNSEKEESKKMKILKKGHFWTGESDK